jgi:hypothetical protein
MLLPNCSLCQSGYCDTPDLEIFWLPRREKVGHHFWLSFLLPIFLRLATLSFSLSTPVHNFAQIFPTNLIDAQQHKEYLPRQIEPGSVRTLRLSSKNAAT